MLKCSSAFLLLSVCAWTQALPLETPKEAVVAVVNGRKVTLSDFQRMVESQEPQMRALAMSQPKAFLEQYALYESVLAEAEKAGFDRQSPFKEKIAMSRRQILVTGFIDDRHKNFAVTEADAKKFYETNPNLYNQAMVRVVYISRMAETRNIDDGKVTAAATPEEILAKVEKAARKAREGEDFAKVAKEFSDDPNSAGKGGEFPHPIRAGSANVPAHMRGPILESKAGDIVGPIEHETGYYIFKVLSNGLAPFDQVKEDIVKEMKDAKLRHWLDGFKKESSVSIQNEALLTEAGKAK